MFLGPLDLDMAFTRKDFLPAIGSKLLTTFDQCLDQEKEGFLLALSGKNIARSYTDRYVIAEGLFVLLHRSHRQSKRKHGHAGACRACAANRSGQVGPPVRFKFCTLVLLPLARMRRH